MEPSLKNTFKRIIQRERKGRWFRPNNVALKAAIFVAFELICLHLINKLNLLSNVLEKMKI